MDNEGFLRALFDTRFSTLITPKVIRVLYILAIILIGLLVLVSIIGGFQSSAGAGIVTLVLAPIFFLLYVIISRIWLEIVIVIFKINDSAHAIAHNTGGATSPPPADPAAPTS